MNIKLAKSEVIHFVGIGGIGMSGLSLIMNSKGFKVQGSDISSNKNIDRLKKEKIKIYLDQSGKNLKNATIVVISSAIKKNNPELVEAKRRKILIIKRGESEKHSNFFVNKGNARFSEMKKLIDYVEKSVFEKTGIKIEKEIKILEN